MGISTPESRAKEKGAGFGDVWESLGGGLPWRASDEEVNAYHRERTREIRRRTEEAKRERAGRHRAAMNAMPESYWKD